PKRAPGFCFGTHHERNRDAMHVTSSALILILITLLGATVNGALGYGFSSITVPVALLFYTNRVLNPVLVWIEVLLNAYVLWVNRASVPLVWRRVAPIILGLAPGVMMGTALVHRVQPGWLKLATFVVLLPLILLQAAGVRRPITAGRPVGLAFGGALGVRIIRHVRPETFRRVCMSFDAWVVGYGISTLLQQLALVEGAAAFSVLTTVGLVDTWLLYRFFGYRRVEAPAPASRAGASTL